MIEEYRCDYCNSIEHGEPMYTFEEWGEVSANFCSKQCLTLFLKKDGNALDEMFK